MMSDIALLLRPHLPGSHVCRTMSQGNGIGNAADYRQLPLEPFHNSETSLPPQVHQEPSLLRLYSLPSHNFMRQALWHHMAPF